VSEIEPVQFSHDMEAAKRVSAFSHYYPTDYMISTSSIYKLFLFTDFFIYIWAFILLKN
jgi:hypothetical protein